jgi:ferredoxin
MAYKVKVDKDACIGCGACTATAPNTFEMDDNYKAEVSKQNGDDDETILNAAQACPVDAVEVKDGDKKIHP